METQAVLKDFLRNAATPSLVTVIGEALNRAQTAKQQTHLVHLADRLLDEESVRSRVVDGVRRAAQASLSEQIGRLPTVAGGELDHFAFNLATFVKPARTLAGELGAERVSPLTFLATCLSEDLALDEQSLRTQELLRAAGLTLDKVVAAVPAEAVRRWDFSFKSLGFGTDITAMARSGFWPSCPLVGMEKELRRLVIVLSSFKHSAVIVGEPGVGKSALIHGLAYHMAHRTRPLIPPDMDSWTVVMIEAKDIMAGTGGRGELEKRVDEMLKFFRKNPTVVPFFEEIHRLLDTDDPSSRAIATALKPAMTNKVFRCVGATTDKEYARYIASDEAMNSRFRKILLSEPDFDSAVTIINQAKSHILDGRARELGIDLGDDAVRTAVRVTSTYQRSDRLPRKAIDLLGAAVSEKIYNVLTAGGQGSLTVTGTDVARFFSEIAGIPVDDLEADRAAYYRRLAEKLAQRVRGQAEAVQAVPSWLGLHANGWVDPKRPRGRFLFLGPPGVGKTELAMCLAEEVMRDRGSVIVKNMAEFAGEGSRSKWMGADPGYVGFGQTPTIYSRVMMRAFSVVVLDEFEKAHPSLADPLISVLDGHGEDSQGRWVDFSQCIFVLTSNAITRALHEAGSEEALRSALLMMGGIWTPPLVDRIDRIVLFHPLEQAALYEILDSLVELRRRSVTRPLPPDIDSPAAREAILNWATQGEHSASARRLERSLLRWLSATTEGLTIETEHAVLESGSGPDETQGEVA